MLIKLLALKNAYMADEKGATAIEYGLLAAGIALVIIGAVFAFGDRLALLFSGMADALDGPTS